MTVLQPVKPKHPLLQPTGFLVMAIGFSCLLLGLCLGLFLRELNNVPQSTHWQTVATAAEVEKPVVVKLTPEAEALRAEMASFRATFAEYKAVRDEARAEVFGNGKVAAAPTPKKTRMTTPELVEKITRTLLLDEVDSFLNKVQMVEEVRQHAVGF